MRQKRSLQEIEHDPNAQSLQGAVTAMATNASRDEIQESMRHRRTWNNCSTPTQILKYPHCGGQITIVALPTTPEAAQPQPPMAAPDGVIPLRR